MKKKYLAFITFFIFTFLIVLPQTSFAAASDNFKFSVRDTNYAKGSDGWSFKVKFDKPAKDVHFGAVLDTAKRDDFPLTVEFRLENATNEQTFNYKSLQFNKIGERALTSKYTIDVDPGEYNVYIKVNGKSSSFITGNGFVYYKY
ncbi:hypothetical protein [Bacillus thuringiensis]|uniref:hypothetical protein n=1 Tax=Bacillus thuringiensis TaxID=1428 RepID=UPI000BFA8AEC|nr:hypothetical protein [Bacillus thuringiensis]PFF72442.1 hypothetical protein CN339_20690 [Bacillus thuringiensis]